MAIRIDASGDDLRRASPPDESAITVSGWSNVVADRGLDTYQGLAVLEGTVAATYNGFYWEGNSEAARMESGAAGANFASRPAVGTWFFWAMTSTTAGAGSLIGYWSAATSSTFVTASTTGQASTTNRLTLGNDTALSWMSGRFSAIKVWDAVLTQAELEQEKWSIRPRRWANLHLWAPCRIATELADYSGNGRTLTATGTLTTEDGPPVPWGAGSIILPFVAAAAGTTFTKIAGERFGLAGGRGLA